MNSVMCGVCDGHRMDRLTSEEASEKADKQDEGSLELPEIKAVGYGRDSGSHAEFVVCCSAGGASSQWPDRGGRDRGSGCRSLLGSASRH